MACNRQYGNAWWLKRYNYNLTITTIARSNIFNVQIRCGSWWCCIFVIFWKSFLFFAICFPLKTTSRFNAWLSTPIFLLLPFFAHTHTDKLFAHSNTARYWIDVQFQKIESIRRDRRQKIWTNPSEHFSSNHRGKMECRCVTNLFPFAHEIHYNEKCHTASANYWIIDSLTG